MGGLTFKVHNDHIIKCHVQKRLPQGEVAHTQGSACLSVSSTVSVEFKKILAPKTHTIPFKSLSQTPAEAKISVFFRFHAVHA